MATLTLPAQWCRHSTAALLDQIASRFQELERGTTGRIKIDKDHSYGEDEWMYVAIDQTAPGGMRASEYANWFVIIERELREQGIDNLLIAPNYRD